MDAVVGGVVEGEVVGVVTAEGDEITPAITTTPVGLARMELHANTTMTPTLLRRTSPPTRTQTQIPPLGKEPQ